MGELKRKIGGLGTPNLGAIEEYARVNERYTYLASQRDDVLNSKRELESIIRNITKEMTTIFVAEFKKIDHYFGEVFEEMFGGGKGQLILEDPENPLSCGIEIRVQPPGKQVKTITLLRLVNIIEIAPVSLVTLVTSFPTGMPLSCPCDRLSI